MDSAKGLNSGLINVSSPAGGTAGGTEHCNCKPLAIACWLEGMISLIQAFMSGTGMISNWFDIIKLLYPDTATF